ENDARNSRYSLRNRSKIKKIPFEVPEWGGDNVFNTCIVDSFLAMLICAKWKDPSFPGILNGQDRFTQACRKFLEGGDCDVDGRKFEFIKQLFEPSANGEFDLTGDEANVILDQAKEACAIKITSECTSCRKKHSSIKDYFFAGRDKTRKPVEMMYTAIAQLSRKHRCEKAEFCGNAEKEVELGVPDSTWMLPFDLSQVIMPSDKIALLPSSLEVNGVMFRLRGVSLIGAAHYTCVLYDSSNWYRFDGMLSPPLEMHSSFESLVIEPHNTIKIAYYLRTNQ
ncbi:hypothetical protein PENTCL1PPCAC_22559, partial [Pristionchus entomophagus]